MEPDDRLIQKYIGDKKNQEKPGKFQNVVINLSKKELINNERRLLALGMNYVIESRKISTENFITKAEAAIEGLSSAEAKKVHRVLPKRLNYRNTPYP